MKLSTFYEEISIKKAQSLLFHSLVLLIIAIVTVNTHYHFGDGNHIEQLPHIFAQRDDTYLTNDFFVSYTREVNPRYYYAYVIAHLSNVLPLEQLFYIATLMLNYFVYLITFYVVRELTIDYASERISPNLVAYGSIGLLSFFTFAQLGGAASIFEPTLIPHLVALPFVLLAYWQSIKGNTFIVWLCCLFALLFQPSLTLLMLLPICGNILINQNIQYRTIRVVILIATTTLASYFLFIQPTGSFALTDQSFIYILAYFRHPHHYIPSEFLVRDYLASIIMLLTLGSSLIYLVKTGKHFTKGRYFVLTIILSLGLLFAGYIFVEVIPVRTVVSLQTFRIMFLLRWLFIIVAPLAITVIMTRITSTTHTNTALLLTTGMLITASVMQGGNTLISPQITNKDTQYLEIFTAVSMHTPTDATFLTPPDFGGMRVFPKRAIVVDTKSFPFNDSHMQEWYERIINCYGEGNRQENYARISDKKLLELKELYGFDYAVLYIDTNTRYEIIFQDSEYKIIRFS